MRLVKFLILLLFAGLVFGGAAFFGYQLFVKPDVEDRKDEVAVANAPEPTPTPDYSLPAFETALALIQAGKPFEARDALLNFLVQYPQSTKLAEARALLGQINTDEVFTSMEAPGKVEYTVVKGDSLLKIASKTNSNAELILRANNLVSIDLQIGQQLRIPQMDPSILVDQAAGTVTLYDGGRFFKEYPLLSIKIPSLKGGEAADMTIKDKLALDGSNRMAFGSPGYVGSERWLMLDQGGIVIRGLHPPKDGSEPSMAAGVVVSQEAIEEIFPLVSRGTPVTIQ